MAATNPSAGSNLHTLQSLINEVLVQTGKAIRASRRDAQANVTQPQAIVPSKLPDTITAFHAALDDLDSNIIQAKSVLLRDLNQIKAKQSKLQPPAGSQTQAPTTIDLDSSPIATPTVLPISKIEPGGNMVVDSAQLSIDSKPENNMMQLSNTPDPDKLGDKIDMTLPEGAFTGAMVESNFTDMEFAPADGPNPSFDLTNFAPNDNPEDMLSLEALVPSATQQQDQPSGSNMEGVQVDNTDSEFADLFGNDESQADGMDFDFSIGGGGGGGGGLGDDTFDDLMNNRDDTFTLANDEFDTPFFGLDKK